MKKDNVKDIIIGMLLIFILILGVLCVLFANNIINFDAKNNNDLLTDNKSDEVNIEAVYSGWNIEVPINSITLVLFSDNKFNMCMRYECFDGKYTINDSEVLLTTNANDVYPESITISYTFDLDKTNLKSNNSSVYCDLKRITNLDNANEKRYYQYYQNYPELSGDTNDILVLNNDGTARYYGHKVNAGSWSYEGIYTETNTEIIFKGYATDDFKEVGGTDLYSITFKKVDNAIVDEIRNWTYENVNKKDLK